MTKKQKDLAVLILTGVLIFTLGLWCVLRPADALSRAERRALAQLPELTADSVLDGSFMTDFESFTLDQFPLRDRFRALKAWTLRNVLGRKDDHGIYLSGGYAAKLDYPQNEASLTHAAERFTWVYETYLSGRAENVYFAAIPDKNCFLAAENGYPSMDYDVLFASLEETLPWAEHIDLRPALSLDSYYRTDIHWRQEALVDAARLLAGEMGVTLREEYETVTLDAPFYGVYCGQSALNLAPDALRYLDSELLRACTVYDYETDRTLPLYDLSAADQDDPYALFLWGSRSMLTIEDPNAQTDRELVIFRDSFASSLAPLLAEGYAKITLIDIRYVAPERLGTWFDFAGADVLFLYSTPVLNSSETIR